LKAVAFEGEIAAKSKIEPMSVAKRMRFMIFSELFCFCGKEVRHFLKR
jgi:hypothetical protein